MSPSNIVQHRPTSSNIIQHPTSSNIIQHHPTSSKIIHHCFQVTSDFHMPRATYIFKASANSLLEWGGRKHPASEPLALGRVQPQFARSSLAFAAEFPGKLPHERVFARVKTPGILPGILPAASLFSQAVFNYFYMTFEEHFKDDPLWKDPVKWLCEKRWKDSQASDVFELGTGNII